MKFHLLCIFLLSVWIISTNCYTQYNYSCEKRKQVIDSYQSQAWKIQDRISTLQGNTKNTAEEEELSFLEDFTEYCKLIHCKECEITHTMSGYSINDILKYREEKATKDWESMPDDWKNDCLEKLESNPKDSCRPFTIQALKEGIYDDDFEDKYDPTKNYDEKTEEYCPIRCRECVSDYYALIQETAIVDFSKPADDENTEFYVDCIVESECQTSSGYYKETNASMQILGQTVTQNLCGECPSFCDKCQKKSDGSLECLKCEEGYALHRDPEGVWVCLDDCPPGYFCNPNTN